MLSVLALLLSVAGALAQGSYSSYSYGGGPQGPNAAYVDIFISNINPVYNLIVHTYEQPAYSPLAPADEQPFVVVETGKEMYVPREQTEGLFTARIYFDTRPADQMYVDRSMLDPDTMLNNFFYITAENAGGQAKSQFAFVDQTKAFMCSYQSTTYEPGMAIGSVTSGGDTSVEKKIPVITITVTCGVPPNMPIPPPSSYSYSYSY